MNILITGASGFIGRTLAADFLARGHRVRGLVRPSSARLPGGVERAEAADLSDSPAVQRAARGMDVVVHLAARVHVMRDQSDDPLAEFRAVNVDGTRTLLEAADIAGVERFLFASSVKAVGESNKAPWTEAAVPAPVDPYGVSKLEAENVVRRYDTNGSLRTSILRLPLVYGPGVGANMLRLFELVDRRIPLPFLRIANQRSLVYIGNLAAAADAVLQSDGAAGEIFFVSDGDDLTTPQLVRLIARSLDRPALLFPIPESVFRMAGRIGDRASPLMPMFLTTAAVERLVGSLTVDTRKLRKLTGFKPPFTPAKGIQETADWFRTRGSHDK
jgi:nucleoside-diphosphate-sugar epimerase